jgi:hypothetical protein
MRQTSYGRAPGTKKCGLAEATWPAFSPSRSRYPWAFDDPRGPPRAAAIASALQNRGKPGSHTFRRAGMKTSTPWPTPWSRAGLHQMSSLTSQPDDTVEDGEEEAK